MVSQNIIMLFHSYIGKAHKSKISVLQKLNWWNQKEKIGLAMLNYDLDKTILSNVLHTYKQHCYIVC